MNILSQESSPYLLQHAHNPVDWFPWCKEAWEKGEKENKLVLVSIGYSSCHWCHVMEREVFEDHECAEYMNTHFVCIKVDREERPDVDSTYMDAIHLMGQRGGWPLNVFTLPDKRPVYGGTYFPKKNWIGLLENLVHMHRTEAQKMIVYAEKMQHGLNQLSKLEVNRDQLPFDAEYLEKMVHHWKQYWDKEEGGNNRAPKFPMPCNWEFLLHYAAVSKDEESAHFVHLTLQKMARGGIFDQIGGGFARYSVDGIWKVPHFEKMLYDNAQLLALYAQAHRHSPQSEYEDIIELTMAWLEREMHDASGLYYAALDADSEGEEGLFYVWTNENWPLQESMAAEYYQFGLGGVWEHDRSILLRNESDAAFAARTGIALDELQSKKKDWRHALLEHRSKRIRPGLDYKCITSWNAMLLSGFCEAYKSLQLDTYLEKSRQLAEALVRHAFQPNDKVWHCITSGKAAVDGMCEDYITLATAFLDYYEISSEEIYLSKALHLTGLALDLFMDEEDGMMRSSISEDISWAGKRKDVQDNVIPSANSLCARLLIRLSRHFENEEFLLTAEQMIKNVLPQLDYAGGYASWLTAYSMLSSPSMEVVITGPNALDWQKEMWSDLHPNTLVVASTSESSLPLFRNRFGMESAIYVCRDRTCSAPVHATKEAIRLLK